MLCILAVLTPRDAATDTRPELRACSVQDRRVTALDGEIWYPAITGLPTLTMRLFEGDFSSDIDVGTATLTVQLDKIDEANIRRYSWAGAGVTLYAGEVGDAWPWDIIFTGKTDRFEAQGNRVKFTATVDIEPFEADVLSLTYAGTTGAEGDANLKNKLKPWVFGRAMNVEPVLINSVDNVYQFSAYGPIQDVTALFERGDAFEAALADYADYAALVGATIPAGKWATCLALGMVRLGAPAYGLITGDVEGHIRGVDYLQTTGEIIACIADRVGVEASLDTDSLDALDAAVAAMCPDGGTVNLVLTDQTSLLDLARRLARPCNAQVGVSWLGKLFACRVEIGTAALTLDAQARQLPLVASSIETDVRPPFWKIVMGGDRAWRVHALGEVATFAELIDRGTYSATEAYREGNLVYDQDIQWRYINPSMASGNAPPTLPVTLNSYWEAVDPKLGSIEASADVTKAIIGPPTSSVIAKSDGTFETGVLPKTVLFRLQNALGIDLTGDADWTVTVTAGSATVTSPMDVLSGYAVLSVSALGQTTTFEVAAELNGIVVATFVHRMEKVLSSISTGSSGSGGTSGSSPITGTNNTESYGTITSVIRATAGSAGTVTCTAPIEITCVDDLHDTSVSGTAKWRWRAIAGSFADIDTPIAADPAASVIELDLGLGYDRTPGQIDCNMTKTGLTPGTEYEFAVEAKVDEASRALTFAGAGGSSAQCVGS